MTDDIFDDDDAHGATRRRKQDHAAVIRLGLTEAMRSRAGRAWIWSVLTAAGLEANTFATDPMQSAYLVGRRSVAVELHDAIRAACPDQYLTMIRESMEK